MVVIYANDPGLVMRYVKSNLSLVMMKMLKFQNDLLLFFPFLYWNIFKIPVTNI